MLIANWRQVLKRAWSIRLLILAGLLSGLEIVLQIVGASLPFPPIILTAAIGVTTAAAFVARLVAQQSVGD